MLLKDSDVLLKRGFNSSGFSAPFHAAQGESEAPPSDGQCHISHTYREREHTNAQKQLSGGLLHSTDQTITPTHTHTHMHTNTQYPSCQALTLCRINNKNNQQLPILLPIKFHSASMHLWALSSRYSAPSPCQAHRPSSSFPHSWLDVFWGRWEPALPFLSADYSPSPSSLLSPPPPLDYS